jgi:RNA polymerase I-specific transcription initiation factor RRN6
MKWIARSRPETFPANAIASVFAKSSFVSPPSYRQLLAVGGAINTSHQPGHRTDPIIAIPGGEAGHVLRLIRPDVEYRGWRKQSAVRVPLLDATSRDIGYWVGTGGTIYQITLADELNVLGSLLAVRQDSMITIFRPMYHEQPVRAVMPSGYHQQYPPSRLSANPVAVLTADTCGSRRHADVSFNPFYTRQFSVVDDSGHWSIWDVEGSMRKSSGLELIPGKSGGIYDDFVLSHLEKSPNTADGWHRVLWATNVSTIVVCNRCHINVFDVKTTPTRLPGPGSLSTKASDWILDIKRSPMDPSHLFVLTTSRIFWIEVIAAEVNKDGHEAGLRVILSYRHFRDVSDETMSLTALKDDNGKQLQKKWGYITDDHKFLLSYHQATTHLSTSTPSQWPQGVLVPQLHPKGPLRFRRRWMAKIQCMRCRRHYPFYLLLLH